MSSLLTVNEQFQALNMLDFVTELFTIAGKETFTREDILVVLDSIRSDPAFFDVEVLIAQQIATAEPVS